MYSDVQIARMSWFVRILAFGQIFLTEYAPWALSLILLALVLAPFAAVGWAAWWFGATVLNIVLLEAVALLAAMLFFATLRLRAALAAAHDYEQRWRSMVDKYHLLRSPIVQARILRKNWRTGFRPADTE